MNKEKTLIIVESPTKARKIQEYLGSDYIVVSCKGHITDLAKGGKQGIGIDIKNNFKPHYVLMDHQVETLQMIMDEAKKCSNILLVSDPDREGEGIAYHLLQRLKDFDKNIKRAEIHEITKKAIIEATKSLRDVDMAKVHAYEARRMLDRIVGFMASPFLMTTFGSKTLSAGRVQSVITRMIVDREAEINSFVPEEYWNIHAKLSNGTDTFTAKYEPRISNQDDANKVKDILQNASTFTVLSVEASEEKKKPLPPLITAKLQQIMSKRFGMDGNRTMAAAQSLYENGLITYMRTDSVRIGDDALKASRKWLKENQYDVPKSANHYKTKNSAADAHECIRPTDVSERPERIGLSSDEREVYEIIWRYFLASQMMPAIYDTLKIKIQVNNQSEHILIASGKALKYKGFLEMLGANDDSRIDIPYLKVNDKLHLMDDKSIVSEKKQTQPLPRYSEANLIETLEKKEIGRPSTYASLLATVATRNYVEKRGNVFYPTDLGKQITHELTQWFSFLEYTYSASMEKNLDEIEEGKLDHIKMLKDFYDAFSIQLKKAYMKHGAKSCDKCDGVMKEIVARSGDRFMGCSNYPRCSGTQKIEIKSVA